MGKAVKIFLVLALLVSLGGFTMSVLSVQQAGLSIGELTQIIKHNMQQLNMGVMVSEYSEIQESMAIEADGEVDELIIRSTFPELVLREGEDFAVHFYGNVSNELDDLLSWQIKKGTLTLDIAEVHNANPSSTGLVAEIVVPSQEFERIRIATVSGSVQVSGIKAQRIEVTSNTGAVHLMDSAVAELAIKTASGDQLVLDERTMDLSLESDSGTIEVMAAAIAGEIQSQSGRIQLTWQELTDDVTLKSASGNQEIFFQGEDLAYDLSSNSGWVNVSHEDHEHAGSGRIGPGNRQLTGTTGSGSIVFAFTEAAEEDGK